MGVVSRGHTFLWKSRRADGAFPRRWATHGLSSSMERNPPCRNIRGFRRPSRRLKSASSGAPRQASASADAGNVFRSAQADRRPKALKVEFIRRTSRPLAEGFAPIEIGLPRRDAPSVGLRRRKGFFSVDAGRPSAEGPWGPNSFGTQADRRPQAPQVEFIRHPPRHASASNRASPLPTHLRPCQPQKAKSPSLPDALPILERNPPCRNIRGFRRPSRRLKSASSGAPRQASASADAQTPSRSAQADRRPKAPAPIEIGLPRRWRAGRRPSPTQKIPPGRRRPTVGRRPYAD